MPAKYFEAEEVKNMAIQLIANHHQHLLEAKICFIFREGTWTSKNRETWGTAKKTSATEKFLTGYDFIITINRKIWDTYFRFNRAVMEALVDHELQHCCKDEDKKGNPVFYIQNHDLEDFAAIVRRHGLWSEELKKMETAKEIYYKQMAMPFEEKPEKGSKSKKEREPELAAAATGS